VKFHDPSPGDEEQPPLRIIAAGLYDRIAHRADQWRQTAVLIESE